MTHPFTRALLAGCVVASVTACNRGSKAPELQTATTTSPQSQTTVAGCVRSGLAENTFVLMSDETNTANPTANYQLIARSGLDLKTYVGQRVQVSGTINTSERVTSTSGSTPEPRAKESTATETRCFRLCHTQRIEISRTRISLQSLSICVRLRRFAIRCRLRRSSSP